MPSIIFELILVDSEGKQVGTDSKKIKDTSPNERWDSINQHIVKIVSDMPGVDSTPNYVIFKGSNVNVSNHDTNEGDICNENDLECM